MKNTVETFRSAKGKTKLSMVTAYDFTLAAVIEKAGINAVLVGDSLGMVVLGYENTLSVTMEDMIHHTRAVSRACSNTLVVSDLPFMSYQKGVTDAVTNAGRLVQEGRAQAVKLEGGAEFVDEIKAMVRASIPVMGHLGLTPQSVNAFGGFKVQGKSVKAAQKLLDDARAIQDAGVFSLVLEGIPSMLGAKITQELDVPTIGIGAGSECDGQVLVWQDMLGLSPRKPKFAKCYWNAGEAIFNAFQDYANEVATKAFPSREFCYSVENEAEIIAQLH